MRLVRALPMVQLMPAASSRQSPVATALPGGRPGKNERPHSSPGTPHRPSRDRTSNGPRTQIRLGAGAHTALASATTNLATTSVHRRQP